MSAEDFVTKEQFEKAITSLQESMDKKFTAFASAQTDRAAGQQKLALQSLQDWRKKTLTDLNNILAPFQQDIIKYQTVVNAAWNGMNVVLRVFVDKGTITEDDVKKTSQVLFKEAKENEARARASMIIGRAPDRGEMKAPPLEQFLSSLQPRDESESSIDSEKKED